MPESVPELTRQHLDDARAFYASTPVETTASSRKYRAMLAHYYNLLISPESSVLEVGCGSGELLLRIDAKRKVGIDLCEQRIEAAKKLMPESEFHTSAGELFNLNDRFDVIIVSDTLNFAADVQALLEHLHAVSHDRTRLIVNFPSALWRPVFAIGQCLGIKHSDSRSNWLSADDVYNLMELSDWRPLNVQPRLLAPVGLLGLERLINRWIAPIFPALCLTVFCVARSARISKTAALTVSVVIPARNEAGNIEAAAKRTPDMGAGTELIFVEGHSKDGTWDEIQRIKRENPHRKIKILQQTGKGKGDAVRAGFAAATGELLMILDADLTVPPEELTKFYDAVASGRAEFANGSRLVYPMEKHAMQFLNMCANKTFGLLFTRMLGQHLKDTLCGTKVLKRTDYERIAANRSYFGQFDPFGDFDLLFGAAKLNLKIADIPVRYRDRTYGTTNIHRWSHGWLLLRMVGFAARKIKFV